MNFRRLSLILLVPVFAACATTEAPGTTSTQPTTAKAPATAASKTPVVSSTTKSSNSAACSYQSFGKAAKDATLPSSEGVVRTGDLKLTFATSAGNLVVTGDRAKTPCTLNAFESLAKQNYFSNTTCHRLTTDGLYVLQCGDPSATGRGGPGFRFNDELTGKETYPAGTVAMANSGPDTNGSQFFVVYKDSKLSPNYTVFGKLDAEGLAAVQKVAEAGVQGGGKDGKPATTVTITGVTVN